MIRNNADEGYKFIIVVLAGTVSFFYTLLNYTQSKAFNLISYKILIGFISFSLILIVAFFIYFIIKGISIETQGEDRDKWNAVATKIYLINYSMLSAFLIIMIVSYIIFIVWEKYEPNFLPMFIPIIIFLIFIYFISPKLNKIMVRADVSLYKVLILTIILTLFWLFLFFYLTHSSYLGTIDVDMDKIYYKNNEPIPVLIKLTGPDSHFLVILFKEESNNLIPLWKIKNLEPNYVQSVQSNFTSNDHWLASSLGNGKYTIYINTTNLTPGYYQLKCSRPFDKASSDSGFYLLDNKNESLI